MIFLVWSKVSYLSRWVLLSPGSPDPTGTSALKESENNQKMNLLYLAGYLTMGYLAFYLLTSSPPPQ